MPTSTRTGQQQAHSMAREIQMYAEAPDREPDPQAIAHEQEQYRLWRIARHAPQARTAWAYLTLHGVHPIPLNPDLEPAAEPLATVDAILEHDWADDQSVGLATGQHPTRPVTYLALKVDMFQLWNDWVADAAKVVDKVKNTGGWADLGRTAKVGPPIERVRYRDPGGYSRLSWAPPPLPTSRRWDMDAEGGDLLREMKKQRQGRGGWLWLALDDPDGKIAVRKAKELTPGVQVLATGTVVPWDGARTADGWTLRLEAPAHSDGGLKPFRAPVAPWLLKQITGNNILRRS